MSRIWTNWRGSYERMRCDRFRKQRWRHKRTNDRRFVASSVQRLSVFIFEIVEQLFANIFKTVVLIAPWVSRCLVFAFFCDNWSTFDLLEGGITVRCSAASARSWMLNYKRYLGRDNDFVVGHESCVSWCFLACNLIELFTDFWELWLPFLEVVEGLEKCLIWSSFNSGSRWNAGIYGMMAKWMHTSSPFFAIF